MNQLSGLPKERHQKLNFISDIVKHGGQKQQRSETPYEKSVEHISGEGTVHWGKQKQRLKIVE